MIIIEQINICKKIKQLKKGGGDENKINKNK